MNKKITALTGTIALVSMLTTGAYASGTNKEARPAISTVQQEESKEVQNLKLQISLLEQALAPVKSKDAAMNWGKALASRNGAVQYALFTKELKKSTAAYFEQNGWVTGGSSPWVKTYKITKEKKLSHSVYQYTFEFNLASSTGAAGKESATVNVKQVNKNWYIDKVAMKPKTTISFRTPYVSEQTFTYRAAEYAFSIPLSWDTKYTAAEKEGNLVFKYKPKNEKITARTLFSIEKISEKVWEKGGFSEGLYKKLAAKDGVVYAILPASENQYADMPNSIEYKEFNDMSLQVNLVSKTFMLGHQ